MKINLSKFIAPALTTVRKHSPEILTGIGIAGMFGSMILAVKATPKAVKQAEERKAETVGEKVKAGWKCYIPTAVTFACSTACLIGASSTSLRRNAALATAYSLSETALKEYVEKTKEVVGEKKEQQIRDGIAAEKVRTNVNVPVEVPANSMESTLCFDGVFGRYFYSNQERIRRAAAEINTQIVTYGYASVNDFFDKLDLEQTDIGDELGWNSTTKQFSLYFTSTLTADGRPVVVFHYSVAPNYNDFS